MTRDEEAFFVRVLNDVPYFAYNFDPSMLLALNSRSTNITAVVTNRRGALRICSKYAAIERARDDGRLHLAHIDIGPTDQTGGPLDASKYEAWPDYIKMIGKQKSIGIVCINGSFRIACALYALMTTPSCAILVNGLEEESYQILKDFVAPIEAFGSLALCRRSRQFDTKRAEELWRVFCWQPDDMVFGLCGIAPRDSTIWQPKGSRATSKIGSSG